MSGIFEYVPKRSYLHYAACVHYCYLVAHLGNYAEVVRDEDVGGVALFLKVVDKVQYLRLYRNVQRRGGLVCYQKLRMAGEGDGDDYALLHAAGKLVRVLAEALLWYTYEFQGFFGLFPGFDKRALIVQPYDLHYLLSDAVYRVESCHGILEYHGYLVSAYVSEFLFAELYEVFSVKDYLSVGDDGRGYRKQLHYGKGYRSLACSGLSYKAESLSSFQVEADIVYCVDHAGIGLILY